MYFLGFVTNSTQERHAALTKLNAQQRLDQYRSPGLWKTRENKQRQSSGNQRCGARNPLRSEHLGTRSLQEGADIWKHRCEGAAFGLSSAIRISTRGARAENRKARRAAQPGRAANASGSDPVCPDRAHARSMRKKKSAERHGIQNVHHDKMYKLQTIYNNIK